LLERGYQFTAITPASHERVLARDPDREARDLRDVFGWSRPFSRSLIGDELAGLLQEAGALREAGGGRHRSAVRFASLGGRLHVHSAFPTTEADAVFFGPDTYRFAALLARRVRPRARRLLDVGAGSGAGGLMLHGQLEELVLADLNPRALQLARVNAQLAGARGVTFVASDLYAAVEGSFDAIVANPPYLVDAARRAYRHGGGSRGTDLAVRIVSEGLGRLRPGGQLVLYTATPIVDGQDLLREALGPILREHAHHYEELDPDVFGEELAGPAYADVDRLSLVGLTIDSPRLV
jgi:methylase of polypeptide subunit release factors